MSPFRGQLSDKPLLVSVKYVSTPRSKHNGASRVYLALEAVAVVILAAGSKDGLS